MVNFTDKFKDDDRLSSLPEDLPDEDKNPYISDPKAAVDLISELIHYEGSSDVYLAQNIRRLINNMFASLSEWSFENKLDLYQEYMRLCDRMLERQKINLIHDKVVVSVGGKFSSGKSQFINDISGIKTLLPVSTVPTTSIPTYILKSNKDEITANSIWGYDQALTKEALEALSHHMDDVLSSGSGRETGFAPFIESIVVESTAYSLPENIVLLDTPGYTKYDNDVNVKKGISDRQRSHEQLSKTDHLIWLIDIENGTITEDDIRFIESLQLKTPILIVLTKADLKPESQLKEILSQVKDAVRNSSFECFGITAYSSEKHKEYVEKIINDYIKHCAESSAKVYRIEDEFKRLEDEMRLSIENAQKEGRITARSLFESIARTDKVLESRSLTELWGKCNQDSYELTQCLNNFERGIRNINNELKKYT